MNQEVINFGPEEKNSEHAELSRVPGVHFSKDTGKWIAYIKISGKRKHLGCFTDFEDAVLARKKAEYILGFHPNNGKDISTYNVGNSNYSKHVIQP